MKFAIITGEASGDRVGAQLASEIRRLRPDAELFGTGGQYLRDVGVEVLVDSSRWGVVGIASALKVLPTLLHAYSGLKRELVRRNPDVVIPVDAGGFNLGFAGIQGLCPWTREHLPQTKILYYFPPGSWRRTLKTSPLAQLTDQVATPFPWSEDELRRLGVNATFVGHPLLDLVRPSEPLEKFAERWGIDRERPIVGILPGSRAQEISEVLPVQLAAASIIHSRVPGTQFVLALAPTVDRETVIRQVERERRSRQSQQQSLQPSGYGGRGKGNGLSTVPVPADGNGVFRTGDLEERQQEWIRRAAEMPPTNGDFPIAIIENATYDVMSSSDVLLITSGTATLEAAIIGKPMVIAYRMASVNQLEYQFVKAKLPRFIGMPNILADKGICPEFVQDAATPEALAGAVIGLLLEPERMMQMREDLRAATTLLGTPGGATRTAQMAVELAEKAIRERAAAGGGK